MFEYKDSFSLGAAVLLALLAVALDMLFVRIGLCIAAATFFIWPFLHRRWKMTLPITLALVAACALVVGLVWQLSVYGLSWKQPTEAPKSAKPWKHKLEDLYGSDFGLLSLERKIDAAVADPARGLEPTHIQMRFRLYQDFNSNSDFVSIFVPVSNDVRVDGQIFDVIKTFRDGIKLNRELLHKDVGIGASAPGTPYTEAKDMVFSGRVFIYTQKQFTIIQLGELTSWYQQAGLNLQIRGQDYWWANKDR